MNKTTKEDIFKAIIGATTVSGAFALSGGLSLPVGALTSIGAGLATNLGSESIAHFLKKGFDTIVKTPKINEHLEKAIISALQQSTKSIEEEWFYNNQDLNKSDRQNIKYFLKYLCLTCNDFFKEYSGLNKENIFDLVEQNTEHNQASFTSVFNFKYTEDIKNQFSLPDSFIAFFNLNLIKKFNYFIRITIKEGKEAKNALDLLYQECFRMQLNELLSKTSRIEEKISKLNALKGDVILKSTDSINDQIKDWISITIKEVINAELSMLADASKKNENKIDALFEKSNAKIDAIGLSQEETISSQQQTIKDLVTEYSRVKNELERLKDSQRKNKDINATENAKIKDLQCKVNDFASRNEEIRKLEKLNSSDRNKKIKNYLSTGSLNFKDSAAHQLGSVVLSAVLVLGITVFTYMTTKHVIHAVIACITVVLLVKWLVNKKWFVALSALLGVVIFIATVLGIGLALYSVDHKVNFDYFKPKTLNENDAYWRNQDLTTNLIGTWIDEGVEYKGIEQNVIICFEDSIEGKFKLQWNRNFFNKKEIDMPFRFKVNQKKKQIVLIPQKSIPDFIGDTLKLKKFIVDEGSLNLLMRNTNLIFDSPIAVQFKDSYLYLRDSKDSIGFRFEPK